MTVRLPIANFASVDELLPEWSVNARQVTPRPAGKTLGHACGKGSYHLYLMLLFVHTLQCGLPPVPTQVTPDKEYTENMYQSNLWTYKVTVSRYTANEMEKLKVDDASKTRRG